jgi:hypothetical protein
MMIENFLTTINCTENIDELTEIKLKIDEEITKMRAKDKGGNNGVWFDDGFRENWGDFIFFNFNFNFLKYSDCEIKLQLSSFNYLKKRIEQNISNLKTTSMSNSENAFNVGGHLSPLISIRVQTTFSECSRMKRSKVLTIRSTQSISTWFCQTK